VALRTLTKTICLVVEPFQTVGHKRRWKSVANWSQLGNFSHGERHAANVWSGSISPFWPRADHFRSSADERTFSDTVDMSQRCYQRTSARFGEPAAGRLQPFRALVGNAIKEDERSGGIAPGHYARENGVPDFGAVASQGAVSLFKAAAATCFGCSDFRPYGSYYGVGTQRL
jgi:hypothetical protein